MKRFLQAALLTLCAQEAFATGILNVLLAAGILPLTSSVSPTSVTYDYPAASFTSSSTTCSGAGGAAPYTYAWSFASGGTGITITNPSSATTSFSGSGIPVNTTYSGVAQCQVTDLRGYTSPYSDFSVSLSHIPLLPPSLGTATLVAAQNFSAIGYYSGSYGSLSPAVDYNGNTVTELRCTVSTGGYLYLRITQPSSDQTYITALSINGILYAESSATYSFTGTSGLWAWNISCPMVSGNTYNVFYY